MNSEGVALGKPLAGGGHSRQSGCGVDRVDDGPFDGPGGKGAYRQDVVGLRSFASGQGEDAIAVDRRVGGADGAGDAIVRHVGDGRGLRLR